jgi:hypothetical protein
MGFAPTDYGGKKKRTNADEEKGPPNGLSKSYIWIHESQNPIHSGGMGDIRTSQQA